MSATVKILHRVFVPANTIEIIRPSLERTQDRVWLSKTESCLRYTIRGIPAKRTEFSVTETIDPDRTLVLEIAEKTGHYNGSVRIVYTLRNWSPQQMSYSDSSNRLVFVGKNGRLMLSLTEGEATIICAWNDGGWTETYQRLRSDLTGYDFAAVVIWHWRRYYHHLNYNDARLLADGFLSLHPECVSLTLAEVNRLASRELYTLSTELGWKKLTDRDRKRINMANLHSWVYKDEYYSMLPIRQPSSTGCGEYTHDAASGKVSMRLVVE